MHVHPLWLLFLLLVVHWQGAEQLAFQFTRNSHGFKKFSFFSVNWLFSFLYGLWHWNEPSFWHSQNSKRQSPQSELKRTTLTNFLSFVNCSWNCLKNIKRSQEKSEERFDKHAKVPNFKLFDKVLIKANKMPFGLSPKLAESIKDHISFLNWDQITHTKSGDALIAKYSSHSWMHRNSKNTLTQM